MLLKFFANFLLDEDYYIDKLLTSKTIHFVLPLMGRVEIFKRFMLNYEKVCLESGENVKLAVVLFENGGSKLVRDEHNKRRLVKQSELIRRMFDELRKRYALDAHSLVLVVNGSDFSRSIGCELGAAQFPLRSLLFFVDVDISFTGDFLLRARLNTIEFKQV